MLVNEIPPILATYWPLILLTATVLHLLRNKFYNGLNRYPGPPLAGYTNWWRFLENLGRRTQQTHIALHRKHGDIVRLGPNVLSFADPRALKTIYGLNKGMTKSAFYPVQQAVANGERLHSLFSTRDETYHSRYRRAVNGIFAMSALVGYEPLVDRMTDVFITKTAARYCDDDTYGDISTENQRSKACNFSRWLQFFAFDVIGEITWSRQLGFVERGEDVEGIVDFVSAFLAYAGPVGQMPWLDLIWEKNPIRLRLQKWGISSSVFPVTRFAMAQAADRKAEMEKILQDGDIDNEKGRPVDLLMKFTKAQHVRVLQLRIPSKDCCR